MTSVRIWKKAFDDEQYLQQVRTETIPHHPVYPDCSVMIGTLRKDFVRQTIKRMWRRAF